VLESCSQCAGAPHCLITTRAIPFELPRARTSDEGDGNGVRRILLLYAYVVKESRHPVDDSLCICVLRGEGCEAILFGLVLYTLGDLKAANQRPRPLDDAPLDWQTLSHLTRHLIR